MTMDGLEVLTRLAQKVRARLEVTEAEMDRIGVLSASDSTKLDVYDTLEARFDALTEVLKLIEEERRKKE